MFQIRPMTDIFAQDISNWKSPNEYHIYSFEPSEELNQELLGGDYVACVNEQEQLVGYFCYGQSAQIPTVENFIYSADRLDIGLGLRPDLCGKGLGRKFLRCGIAYASAHYHASSLRLSVAAFNRRAISVYEACGFQTVGSVTLKTNAMPFQIMIR